ncbi:MULTISPECIES: hypothetical protein [Flammeovirga]|nr:MULTISPECIES: hypothetical protein [Flammeovirga]
MKKNKHKENNYINKFNDAIKNLEHFDKDLAKEQYISILKKFK